MSAFGVGPYDELREQQKEERRERDLDVYRTELVDIQRQIARSRCRRENIAIVFVGVLSAFAVFGLWMLYHVLKTKRLVP